VIVGFIDTHLHQFANLGFGGLEVFGSPVDPSLDANVPLVDARARALPDSDFIYVPVAQAADYVGIGGAAAGGPVVTCPGGSGDCVKITVHGPSGSNDLLNQLIPNGSPSHGTMGYPDMNGWPAFDVLTAQQAYWEWLKRAHKHGLKMIVMLAVNNSVLCQLALHRASYGCGDDAAVDRQIQGAKDLETYIDQRAAAVGEEGFYKIVYSSEEARTAIEDGKLAVVLGTEVDTAWGCEPGTATCDDPFIQARVQDYYEAGIRVVYPVHLMDNRFGGTAVYNGLFELANKIETGAYFNIVACGSPIEWRSDIRDTISTLKVAVDALIIAAIATLGAALPALDLAMQGFMAAFPLMGLMSPLLAGIGIGASLVPFSGIVFFAIAAAFIIDAPGAVGDPTDGNCNNRGLTEAGETLIRALMDHKMIIDVDHTSRKMFDDILNIAEDRGYAGIVTGHTGLLGATLTRGEITGMGHTFHASDSGRNEGNKSGAQLDRILDLGGFVSLGMNGGGRLHTRDFSSSDGVAFNCGRSSQAFAQQYLFATQTLGLTAVGIGSDINGFAGSVAPRYGSKACKGDFPGGYDPSSLAGRIDYGTARDYFNEPLGKYTFGNQTWDFNTDGFAHAGLFPDFIADLRAINLSHADLAPLFNGVEAYVRMWEKIDDDDAPTWRCGTVGEDWHADDVTVPCLSYDFGYGLANAAHANFSLSTNLPNGEETGNAFTGTHATICDAAPSAHCTGVIPAISGINVDKKDPTVTVTTPAAGTPAYIINQAVTANYGCVDGGSGVDDCIGTAASGAAVNTAAVGTHAFNVTGSDNVGHVVNVARPYTVSFKICVFYDQTKAHKSGSAVPIKLTVCDANDVNLSSSSIVLAATGVTLVSTSAPGPLEDAGNANPDHEFRFVSDSYIFNLKTTGLSTGTYALTFTATGDPIPHQVQFQVR
jgi:microsomal dipeptidase-like Zn-dependent dipeptidase